MPLDSGKVIVPGHGRFWLGPVDSPPPGQILAITGTPTQATIQLTVNAVQTAPIVLKAADSMTVKMTSIASALAALSTVGGGNVVVLPGPDVWTFLIILDPAVATPTITVNAGTFTGGTTPAVALNATGRGPFSAFTEIGHTSPDNPLQMNRDGGDVTTLGSWQQDNVDQSRASVNWAMAFSLLQYDIASMKLYHGSNAVVGPDGSVQSNLAGPAATEAAEFLIVRNGAKAQARHYPRVSIIAADGESFDTAKLAEMPIQASILSSNTLSYGFSVSQTGVAA